MQPGISSYKFKGKMELKKRAFYDQQSQIDDTFPKKNEQRTENNFEVNRLGSCDQMITRRVMKCGTTDRNTKEQTVAQSTRHKSGRFLTRKTHAESENHADFHQLETKVESSSTKKSRITGDIPNTKNDTEIYRTPSTDHVEDFDRETESLHKKMVNKYRCTGVGGESQGMENGCTKERKTPMADHQNLTTAKSRFTSQVPGFHLRINYGRKVVHCEEVKNPDGCRLYWGSRPTPRRHHTDGRNKISRPELVEMPGFDQVIRDPHQADLTTRLLSNMQGGVVFQLTHQGLAVTRKCMSRIYYQKSGRWESLPTRQAVYLDMETKLNSNSSSSSQSLVFLIGQALKQGQGQEKALLSITIRPLLTDKPNDLCPKDEYKDNWEKLNMLGTPPYTVFTCNENKVKDCEREDNLCLPTSVGKARQNMLYDGPDKQKAMSSYASGNYKGKTRPNAEGQETMDEGYHSLRHKCDTEMDRKYKPKNQLGQIKGCDTEEICKHIKKNLVSDTVSLDKERLPVKLFHGSNVMLSDQLAFEMEIRKPWQCNAIMTEDETASLEPGSKTYHTPLLEITESNKESTKFNHHRKTVGLSHTWPKSTRHKNVQISLE